LAFIIRIHHDARSSKCQIPWALKFYIFCVWGGSPLISLPSPFILHLPFIHSFFLSNNQFSLSIHVLFYYTGISNHFFCVYFQPLLFTGFHDSCYTTPSFTPGPQYLNWDTVHIRCTKRCNERDSVDIRKTTPCDSTNNSNIMDSNS